MSDDMGTLLALAEVAGVYIGIAPLDLSPQTRRGEPFFALPLAPRLQSLFFGHPSRRAKKNAPSVAADGALVRGRGGGLVYGG